MAAATILDIQCVLGGTNSEYIIKKMSVIDTDSRAIQLWIFKHTFNLQNNKSRSVNILYEQLFIPLYITPDDFMYNWQRQE